MMERSIKSIFIILLLVMLSGCVGPTVRTYSGDKLQKSEVAVIKGWYVLGYDGLYIYSIDDSDPKATKVEVLPGWHNLVIRRYTIPIRLGLGAEGEGPLPEPYVLAAFNFEAGHEYKIKFFYKGILIAGVKIIDATTGAIIFTGYW